MDNLSEPNLKPFNLDKLDEELKNTEDFNTPEGLNNFKETSDNDSEIYSDIPEKKKNKLALKIGGAALAVTLLSFGAYQSFKIFASPNNSEANIQPTTTIESTQASHTAEQNQEVKNITDTTKTDQIDSSNSNSNETTSNTSKPEDDIDTDINTGSNSTSIAEKDTIKVEIEKTKEELIASYEIPAGLSSEEYGNAVIKTMELWRNAGYITKEDDDKLLEEWRNGKSADLPAFAKAKANENAEIFAPALFITDYGKDADLVYNYGVFKDMNFNSIHAHIYTELDKDNKDGFYMSSDVQSIKEAYNNGTERILEIKFTDSINMEDLISSNNKLVQTDGKSIAIIVTSLSDGNTEKISNLMWAN